MSTLGRRQPWIQRKGNIAETSSLPGIELGQRITSFGLLSVESPLEELSILLNLILFNCIDRACNFFYTEEQHRKNPMPLLANIPCGNQYGCASEPTWSAQKLVGGMECGYAPFNWTDPSANETNVKISGGDGYCDGYDVQVAVALAESLNVPLEIRKINWEGLVTALQAGSIDVILAGMSPTAERMEQIAFSTDYFNSEQVVVVRTDSPFAEADALVDFAGATLVSQLGTNQNRLLPRSRTMILPMEPLISPIRLLLLQSPRTMPLMVSWPSIQLLAPSSKTIPN